MRDVGKGEVPNPERPSQQAEGEADENELTGNRRSKVVLTYWAASKSAIALTNTQTDEPA